eukprot:UN05171
MFFSRYADDQWKRIRAYALSDLIESEISQMKDTRHKTNRDVLLNRILDKLINEPNKPFMTGFPPQKSEVNVNELSQVDPIILWIMYPIRKP